MTSDTLQKTIHAAPFRPFVISTADSREILVPHPDFIAHVPGARTVVVMDANGDGYQALDLLLIVGVQVLPRATAETAREG